MSGVQDIAASDRLAFALKSDGSLWGWGENGNCNLGDGTNVDKESPVRIAGRFATVTVAGNRTHALTSAGSVWGWGSPPSGDGTLEQRCTPTFVSTGFRSVYGARNGTYGIKDDGALWAWGNTWSSGTGNETEVSPRRVVGSVASVHLGDYDFLHVLTNSGSIWGWGGNADGEVGSGTRTRVSSAEQIGSGFSQVFDGSPYSAAASKADGSVWMWGFNRFRWFDAGLPEFVTSPTLVLTGKAFVKVASGEYTAIGLAQDGTVWSWGYWTTGDGRDFRQVHEPIPVLQAVVR